MCEWAQNPEKRETDEPTKYAVLGHDDDVTSLGKRKNMEHKEREEAPVI